jgi:hypothetical protein
MNEVVVVNKSAQVGYEATRQGISAAKVRHKMPVTQTVP